VPFGGPARRAVDDWLAHGRPAFVPGRWARRVRPRDWVPRLPCWRHH
jgi:hypothetical protein